MAIGLLITKGIILHMLEEFSGFFKTLVKSIPCENWKIIIQSTENIYKKIMS